MANKFPYLLKGVFNTFINICLSFLALSAVICGELTHTPSLPIFMSLRAPNK